MNLTLDGLREEVQSLFALDGFGFLPEFVLSCHLATRLRLDSVWGMLISPPGSGKTEALNLLTRCEDTVYVDQISSKALSSGFQGENKGGKARKEDDCSLLPDLDGKTWVIRDLSTMLSSRPDECQAFFSQLRTAYDGSFAAKYGNTQGVQSYESKFGMLGGMTPRIEAFREYFAELGERFLFLRFARSSTDLSDVRASLRNQNREWLRRKDRLPVLVKNFFDMYQEAEGDEVIITPEVEESLVVGSQLTATCRSPVHRVRNPLGGTSVVGADNIERGTRIVRQLSMLAKSHALLRGQTRIDQRALDLVARVCRSCIQSRRLLVLERLYKWDLLDTDRLRQLPLPLRTARETLEDLTFLGVTRQVGPRNALGWIFAQEAKDWADKTKLFCSDLSNELDLAALSRAAKE